MDTATAPQKTVDCQKWNDPHWGFKWRAGKEGEEKAGCLRERWWIAKRHWRSGTLELSLEKAQGVWHWDCALCPWFWAASKGSVHLLSNPSCTQGHWGLLWKLSSSHCKFSPATANYRTQRFCLAVLMQMGNIESSVTKKWYWANHLHGCFAWHNCWEYSCFTLPCLHWESI